MRLLPRAVLRALPDLCGDSVITKDGIVLRACPFCGDDEDLKITVTITGGIRVAIECVVCSARGPRRDSELKAAEEWNERANG